MNLPRNLIYAAPVIDTRSRTKSAAFAWSAFFILWFLGSYLLHIVEFSAERDDVHALNAHTEAILTSVADSAAADGIEDDLDDLLDWMVDYGNCVVNESGEMNWDMWGSLFFLLSVATSIGYGNFSVSNGSGQAVTVVFSIVLLPLFLVCMKFAGNVVTAAVKLAPGYPKHGEHKTMMKLALNKACFSTLFLAVALGAWIALVGAMSLTALSDEDRTVGEGLYFGWISLSTIGFGDFVFHMKETKGVGVVFVLVGLPLFGAFISALISLLGLSVHKSAAIVHAAFAGGGGALSSDELRAQRRRKASKLYTDHELLLAATAFSIVDTFNGDDDGTLDMAELKSMLFLAGACEAVGLSDGGGGSSGDPGAEEDLVEDLLAKADPLGVGLDNSAEVGAGLEPGGFLLVLAPLFTAAGHRNEVHKGLAACVLNWVAVGAFVALGGWLLSAIEGSAEDERVENWDAILKSHASNLDGNSELELSDLVDTLIGKGVCSIPECEVYESKEVEKGKDLFRCNTYHRTWDFEGAAFFFFTIISTIGFGSFTPQTTAGIAATVGLSLPGLILFSAALGSLLEIPSLLAEFWHIHFNPDDPSAAHHHAAHHHHNAKRRKRAGKFGGGAGQKAGASERGPPVAVALEEGGGVLGVATAVGHGLGIPLRLRHELGLPGSKTGRAGEAHPRFFVRASGGELVEYDGADWGAGLGADDDDHDPVQGAEKRVSDSSAAAAELQETEFMAIVRGASLNRAERQQDREESGSAEGEGLVEEGGALSSSAQVDADGRSEKRGGATCTPTGLDTSDLLWAAVALVVLAATTCLFAFVLENDNGWTVDESAYFSWIACTTIGLGDYAPSDGSMHWSILILPAGLALVGRVIGSLDSLISSNLAVATKSTASGRSATPSTEFTASGTPLGADLSPMKGPPSLAAAAAAAGGGGGGGGGARASALADRVEPPPTHERLLMALDVVRAAGALPQVARRAKELMELVRAEELQGKPTFHDLLKDSPSQHVPTAAAADTSSAATVQSGKEGGAAGGAAGGGKEGLAGTKAEPLMKVARLPAAAPTPANALKSAAGSGSSVRDEGDQDTVASLDSEKSASGAVREDPHRQRHEQQGKEEEEEEGEAASRMFGASVGAVGASFALMPDMGASMPDMGASMPDMGASMPDLARIGVELGDLSMNRLGGGGGGDSTATRTLPNLSIDPFRTFSWSDLGNSPPTPGSPI